MTYAEYETKEDQRLKINIMHLEQGVNFVDINTAYIDEEVVIGKGTVIGTNVVIQGNTVIGENCIIGQDSNIKNSQIGPGTDILKSVIADSKVGSDTHIGPFAYLRPGSTIGNGCKVGDFVEVKNSTMGDGAKASHLTYIGDSDIGKRVNLGCGVVFVNYDGSTKHRSTVNDDAFVGCNSNIISPVEIGEGAYIAAGSTVTHDVPEGALCVARTKQRVIEGWVAKKGILKNLKNKVKK